MGFKLSADNHILINALKSEGMQLKALEKQMIADEYTFAKAEKYNLELEMISVKIVLLSSSLIESIINTYLTIACSNIQENSLFEELERVDLLKKWTVLPRLFKPTYRLDHSGQLYQSLKELKRKRNSFSHYKPKLIKGGKVVSKGSSDPTTGKTIGESLKKLYEFLELPSKLTEHLLKNADSSLGVLDMVYYKLQQNQ